MAIRVSHTPITLYGQLGQLAGQAEAQTKAAEIQMRQAELAARYDLARMQIEAANQQAQIAHQQQMEKLQFGAFLQSQSEQRAQAWELEKMELNSRQRQELLLKQNELRWQSALQEQAQAQAERDRKKRALDKAVEMGQITQSEADKQKRMIDLDVNLGYAYSGQQDTLEQFLVERLTQEQQPQAVGGSAAQTAPLKAHSLAEAPEVAWYNIKRYWNFGNLGTPGLTEGVPQHVTEASDLLKALPTVPTEDREKLRNIIASGNPEAIHEAWTRINRRESGPDPAAFLKF